jgi:hypothetical protein
MIRRYIEPEERDDSGRVVVTKRVPTDTAITGTHQQLTLLKLNFSLLKIIAMMLRIKRML